MGMTWQYKTFVMFVSAFCAALFIKGILLGNGAGAAMVIVSVPSALALLLMVRYSGASDSY
jgi:hypothetical protein